MGREIDRVCVTHNKSNVTAHISGRDAIEQTFRSPEEALAAARTIASFLGLVLEISGPVRVTRYAPNVYHDDVSGSGVTVFQKVE